MWDGIVRIDFYSGQEILAKVGMNDDGYMNQFDGRVEKFEIADDEQLIGCELEEDDGYFTGVTWVAWRRK